MSPQPSSKPPRARRPIAVWLRLHVSWLTLIWQRLWDRLWPAMTFVTAVLAIAFTDVLPSLPPLLHLLILACFAAGLWLLTARGLHDFAWPTRTDARAHLEHASPVDHRPLTAIEDTLAAGTSPLQRMLWRRHQRQAQAALDRLRSPWPTSNVAKRDVFALRALALLFLFVTAIGASDDAGRRLHRALVPAFGGADNALALKLWITPPAYTNRSPLFVEFPAPKTPGLEPPRTLEVPAGSKALMIATGADHGLSLVLKAHGQSPRVLPLSGLDQETDTTKESHAGGSSRLEAALTKTDQLEVRREGQILTSWGVKWVADLPPTVAILAPPQDAGSGQLHVDYSADDDYGIQAMSAHIVRTQTVDSQTSESEALDVPLPTPPHDHKNTVHATQINLADSPWAGQTVTLQLIVTDQAGQSTTSAAVQTVLPERSFTHPVAQEIAHWRKELIADPEGAASPARESFARLLDHPDAFNGDHVVVLALSAAMYRLTYQAPDDALAGLPELLWRTAVRVEDGDRGAADSRMAAAERDLQNALARGASAAEISRLVDQLQRALAEYTRTLFDSSGNKGADLGGVDNQGNVVSPQDIAAMMDQMRQLSDMGAREQAEQMLSQIQNMLQSLRNAAAGNSDNPEMRAAEQMMRDMRELTETQSQLLNDSFAQARQDQLNGQRKKPTPGDRAAERQENLRQQLGSLAQRMGQMTGQPSKDLNAADKAMQGAEASLKNGDWQGGAETQGVALAKMEAGMREASRQMMRAMAAKGMSGFVQMPRGPGHLGGLGPRNGETEGERINVPNRPDAEGMAQRARAILEELRRRASDRGRPTEEQDYLRRLMKEF